MADPITFQFKALPGVTFTYSAPGAASNWKLSVDGKDLKRKGTTILLEHEGTTHEIKSLMVLDFMAPKLAYQGEEVRPLEPIPWWLMICAMLPLLGLAGGGAIGGGLGGGGFFVNLTLVRKIDNPLMQGLVCVAVAAVCFALAVFLVGLIFG